MLVSTNANFHKSIKVAKLNLEIQWFLKTNSQTPQTAVWKFLPRNTAASLTAVNEIKVLAQKRRRKMVLFLKNYAFIKMLFTYVF